MIHKQVIRYASIGLLLNLVLYGAYLLLTYTFLESWEAMTLTYVSGVLIGFILNQRITFSYHGNKAGALLRYGGSYALGYGINLIALWILVEQAGIPHQVVQGVAVITLPMILFALQRYWVFPDQTH